MKYIIASDLHGNFDSYERLRGVVLKENPDKLIFLGDFGGNGTEGFINGCLARIYCPILGVQGNNDSDSYMRSLDLGNQGRYYLEETDGRKLFFTHGHLYGRINEPPILGDGDVIFYGHYHFPEIYRKRGVWHVCVGSAGRPAGGSDPAFCLFDGKAVKIISLSTGNTVVEQEIDG